MQGPDKERAERRPAASASSSSSSSYLAAEHQNRSSLYSSYRRSYEEEVLLQQQQQLQQQQLQQQQYQMAALAQQMGQTTLSSYNPSVYAPTMAPQHLPYQRDGSMQHNMYMLPPNAESIGAYNNNYDVTSGAYNNGRTMRTTKFRQQPTTDGYLNQSMMPHHSLHSQGMNYNSFSPSSSSSAAISSAAAPMHSARSPRQQFSDTLRRGVQSFAFNPTTGSSTESKREGPPSMSSSSTTAPSTASLPARPDSAIIRAANLAGEAADTMAHSPGRVNTSSTASTAPSAAGGGPPPPPSAPTVPLTMRFPALPPRPDKGDDVDISTLKEKFEAREEALILRIEALGFQPESAWQALEEVQGMVVSERQVEDTEAETDKQRETAAPILGIRLLQKVDSLQRENDELAKVFAEKMTTNSTTSESDEDMHRLIHALDKALSQMTERAEQAEANVSRLEQALAVACLERSSSIVPSDGPSARAD